MSSRSNIGFIGLLLFGWSALMLGGHEAVAFNYDIFFMGFFARGVFQAEFPELFSVKEDSPPHDQ